MPRSCEPRSKRCCPTQRVTRSGLNARRATTTDPLSVACRQRIEPGLAQTPARVARYVRGYEINQAATSWSVINEHPATT